MDSPEASASVFVDTSFTPSADEIIPADERKPLNESSTPDSAKPEFMKTSLCSFFRKGHCKNASGECKFAHGEEELRPRPDGTWDPTSEQGKSAARKRKNADVTSEEQVENSRKMRVVEGSDSKLEGTNLDDAAGDAKEGNPGVELLGDSLRICVKNLPVRWNVENLKSFLSEKGLHFLMAKKRKGMFNAFVAFENKQDLQRAIEVLKGLPLSSRTIDIGPANPRVWECNSKDKVKKDCGGVGSEVEAATRGKYAEKDKRDIRDVVTPLWSLSYDQQLAIKRENVSKSLKNIVRRTKKCLPEGVEAPEWMKTSSLRGGLPCEFFGISPSPVTQGYRNKCEFSFGFDRQGRPAVGFQLGSYREGFTEIAGPMECCHVSPVAKLCSWIFQTHVLPHTKLPVWDKRENKGFWRSLIVREGRKAPSFPTEHLAMLSGWVTRLESSHFALPKISGETGRDEGSEGERGGEEESTEGQLEEEGGEASGEEVRIEGKERGKAESSPTAEPHASAVSPFLQVPPVSMPGAFVLPSLPVDDVMLMVQVNSSEEWGQETVDREMLRVASVLRQYSGYVPEESSGEGERGGDEQAGVLGKEREGNEGADGRVLDVAMFVPQQQRPTGEGAHEEEGIMLRESEVEKRENCEGPKGQSTDALSLTLELPSSLSPALLPSPVLPISSFLMQIHTGVSNAAPADAEIRLIKCFKNARHSSVQAVEKKLNVQNIEAANGIKVPGPESNDCQNGKDSAGGQAEPVLVETSETIPTCHVVECGSIRDHLCGLQFKISPTAFFQVNSSAAECLYSLAGKWAKCQKSTLLYDICCGTGTIGLTLARSAGKVVGVEICEKSIADAKANAKINGIRNVEFVAERAEKALPKLIPKHAMRQLENTQAKETRGEESAEKVGAEEEEIQGGEVGREEGREEGQGPFEHSVAVVDPPRSGLHPAVLRALRSNTRIKRIVYVSCNSETLVNNAVELCTPLADTERQNSENDKTVSHWKGRFNREEGELGAIKRRLRDMQRVLSGVQGERRKNASAIAPPFAPVKVVCFDLFPHTEHCEVVLLLEREGEEERRGDMEEEKLEGVEEEQKDRTEAAE